MGVWVGRVQSCVGLGLSRQLQGGQRAGKLAPRGAPARAHMVRHHRGAHMPDLCGGRKGPSPSGPRGPGSLLALNVKDLG